MNPFRSLTLAVSLGLLLPGCSQPEFTEQSGGFLSQDQPAAITPVSASSSVRSSSGQTGVLVPPGGDVPGIVQFPNGNKAAAAGVDPNFQKVAGSDGPTFWKDNRGDYSLNFVDVEAAEVARTVLRDILEVPYIIDEEVKGRISIETPRPVNRDALLAILEAGLRSAGAALVVEKKVYQVVPREAADKQFSPLGEGSVGVVPVRLRHVKAAILRDALTPFTQDVIKVSADEGQNTLILAGDREQLRNLLDLINSLDVNVLSGSAFAITPLADGDARVIARELGTIFAESGGIRFLPIDRQNAILTIARSRETLESSQTWIQRLDRRGGSKDQGIYVYQVEAGKAKQLAATVSALFGLGSVQGGPEQPNENAVAPTLASAKIADPGAPPPFAAAQEAGVQLTANDSAGTQFEQEGSAQTFGGSGGEEGLKGGAKIVPYPTTNTIVVMATERDWNRIERTLRRLDQAPLQVLIEATVAEVTLTNDLRYGVQFALNKGNNQLSLADNGLDITNALSIFADPIAPGFSYALRAGGGARVLLDALSGITKLNVLSSPQLMVTSNETARLQVGDQVPVPTQTATPLDTNDARVVNTIEFRDTGVILNVTPRVSPSGLISLEILQQVSDVVPTTSSGIDAPTFSQREVKSKVAVQSGETVVLGGLTRDNRVSTKTGVPGLREVPVLGDLFGRTVNGSERTELLVMIQPRIIRNSNDARSIAQELRGRLDRLTLPLGPDALPK